MATSHDAQNSLARLFPSAYVSTLCIASFLPTSVAPRGQRCNAGQGGACKTTIAEPVGSAGHEVSHAGVCR